MQNIVIADDGTYRPPDRRPVDPWADGRGVWGLVCLLVDIDQSLGRTVAQALIDSGALDRYPDFVFTIDGT